MKTEQEIASELRHLAVQLGFVDADEIDSELKDWQASGAKDFGGYLIANELLDQSELAQLQKFLAQPNHSTGLPDFTQSATRSRNG